MYVQSRALSPALSYVETQRGFGSVFTSYTISTNNGVFVIANDNGTFSKGIEHVKKSDLFSYFHFKLGFSVNGNSSLTSSLKNDYNFAFISSTNPTDRFVYRLTQEQAQIMGTRVLQLNLTLWSGKSIRLSTIF